MGLRCHPSSAKDNHEVCEPRETTAVSISAKLRHNIENRKLWSTWRNWRHDIQQNDTQHNATQHNILNCMAMLRLILLSVAFFNCFAKCRYANWRYTEWRYAECRGAPESDRNKADGTITAILGVVVAGTAFTTLYFLHSIRDVPIS